MHLESTQTVVAECYFRTDKLEPEPLDVFEEFFGVFEYSVCCQSLL